MTKRLLALIAFASLTGIAQTTVTTINAPGYMLAKLPFTSPASPSVLPGAAIAVDSAGNLYLSSTFGSNSAFAPYGLVYKILPSGAVSVVAGSASNTPFLGDNGPATSATITPSGIAVDKAGNLYIADRDNNRVRKVDTNGVITTIAGPGGGVLGDNGPATSATLVAPSGIAVDAVGNIFVAEPYGFRIRKISPGGTITTVAGTGQAMFVENPLTRIDFYCACGDGGLATSATLPYPNSVAVDSAGNLYVADVGGARVRKVSANGVITTLAGNGYVSYGLGGLQGLPSYGDGGSAASSQIQGPGLIVPEFADSGIPTPPGIAVDGGGNVYLPDAGRIRVISPDGNINAIAGGGAATIPGSGSVPATSVSLQTVTGLTVDGGGKIYFTSGSTSTGLLALTPSATPVSPLPAIVESNSASGFSAGGSLAASVALGGWMEIYGSYLAPDSRQWGPPDFNGLNAPTSLDGTSVTIAGQPAFVSYISPSQINLQVPSNIGTGSQPLVVKTLNGISITSAVTVKAEQPALLSPPAFTIGGSQYAVALFPDSVTYVLPAGAIPGLASRPAQKGDTVTLYGIGFGPTMPGFPSGQVVGGSNSLTLPVTVTIGGAKATVPYAGLAPGFVGLYQFNVVIPVSYATPTPTDITISLGSGVSATLKLSIQ